MTKSLDLDRFLLGVCYYPEHWSEELWADDFRRMREIGFSVIRVANVAHRPFTDARGVLDVPAVTGGFSVVAEKDGHVALWRR